MSVVCLFLSLSLSFTFILTYAELSVVVACWLVFVVFVLFVIRIDTTTMTTDCLFVIFLLWGGGLGVAMVVVVVFRVGGWRSSLRLFCCSTILVGEKVVWFISASRC